MLSISSERGIGSAFRDDLTITCLEGRAVFQFSLQNHPQRHKKLLSYWSDTTENSVMSQRDLVASLLGDDFTLAYLRLRAVFFILTNSETFSEIGKTI